MFRIFFSLSLLLVLFMGYTLWTGHLKSSQTPGNLEHFQAGILLCTSLVGLHTLVIIYFVGTGKTIKAAIQDIQLPVEYLKRSNEWYRSKGFLWAGLSCVFIVTTLVLGGASDSGRTYLAPYHSAFAYFSVLFNLATFGFEFYAIKKNGVLLQEIDNVIEKNNYPKVKVLLTPEVKPPQPYMDGQKLIFYGVTLLFPYVFLKNGWGWERLPFWPFLTLCLLLCLPGILLKWVYRPSTWNWPTEEKKPLP
jgi:hypothetical protein